MQKQATNNKDQGDARKAAIEETVSGYLNLIPAEEMLALATGDVDIQTLCKLQMCWRGLDKSGKWVGFAQAKQMWFPREK